MATYAPTSAELVSGTLTIGTNAGPHTVAVEVLPTANIFVAPSPADFGVGVIGVASTQPIQIRNLGVADLEITDVRLVDGADVGFALQSLPSFPTILETQATAGFDVTFTPASGEVVGGTVEIDSNSHQRETITLTLTGAGR